MSTQREIHERLAKGLVVGTMCGCEEEGECHDHWQFFVVRDESFVGASGDVSVGATLNKEEMDYLASFVKSGIVTAPDPFCWMSGEGCEPCPGFVGHGDPEW